MRGIDPLRDIVARLRSVLAHRHRPSVANAGNGAPVACSWDAMRAVYREQAAQGIPAAIGGLGLIEQGRWPRSGRPRSRARGTDR